MTYDKLYPHARDFEQPFNVKLRKLEDVVKGTVSLPCWNCSTKTYFISVVFKRPICSQKCEDAKHGM